MLFVGFQTVTITVKYPSDEHSNTTRRKQHMLRTDEFKAIFNRVKAENQPRYEGDRTGIKTAYEVALGAVPVLKAGSEVRPGDIVRMVDGKESRVAMIARVGEYSPESVSLRDKTPGRQGTTYTILDVQDIIDTSHRVHQRNDWW
jgi:hypothetical protein